LKSNDALTEVRKVRNKQTKINFDGAIRKSKFISEKVRKKDINKKYLEEKMKAKK